MKRNFDVYMRLGNSSEAKAKLADLESREWDVGEQLLPNGLRRISKRHTDMAAVESDLQKTLGPELHMELVGSDHAMDKILEHLGTKAPEPSDSPKVIVQENAEHPASKPADGTPPPSVGAPNGSKAPSAAPTPAPKANDAVAQVIHEGAAVLNSPAHLWDYIGDGNERKSLALRVSTDLFRERASYARAVSWSISPEAELFRRAASNDPLAKRMLEVRAGLTQQDDALRRENVESRRQDVALQRVLVAMLGDLQAQVRKWTWLAGWAPGFLIVTLLFGMAMTAWLIYLAGAAKIDAWTLAPAIFALALFIVSPAVLLLRERPLEGIDKWMPSGGTTKADSSSTSSNDSAAGTAGAANGKTKSAQAEPKE